MVKNTIISLLVIGSFILVGCGPRGEKVDSVDSVVGTWHRVFGDLEVFCQVSSNGTYVCADALEKIGNNQGSTGEFFFEGTRYFEKLKSGGGDEGCFETGEYEVYVQFNGNLKYVLTEDECSERILTKIGANQNEGFVEWEPVP